MKKSSSLSCHLLKGRWKGDINTLSIWSLFLSSVSLLFPVFWSLNPCLPAHRVVVQKGIEQDSSCGSGSTAEMLPTLQRQISLAAGDPQEYLCGENTENTPCLRPRDTGGAVCVCRMQFHMASPEPGQEVSHKQRQPKIKSEIHGLEQDMLSTQVLLSSVLQEFWALWLHLPQLGRSWKGQHWNTNCCVELGNNVKLHKVTAHHCTRYD